MELKAKMKFANLNVRREKAGDEAGDTGIDIVFKGSLHKNALLPLFPNPKAAGQFAAGLWDEDGALRPHAVKKVTTDIELEACEVTIDTGIEPARMTDCKVNRVTLTPEHGWHADVSIRVQGHPSPSAEIDTLASVLDEYVDVDIVGRQKSLDFDGEGAGEEQEEAEGAEA